MPIYFYCFRQPSLPTKKQTMTAYNFLRLILCVVFLGFLLWLDQHYLINNQKTLVQVEYNNSFQGIGQCFWTTNGNGFSEANSVKFKFDNNSKYYSFYIPPLDIIKSIRLDPVNDLRHVELKSIVFKQNDLIQRFDSPKQLNELLTPLNKTINIEIEKEWLKLVPQSNDSQILIDHKLLKVNSDRYLRWLLIFVSVSLLWLSLPA